jgi:hypothetical protein
MDITLDTFRRTLTPFVLNTQHFQEGSTFPINDCEYSGFCWQDFETVDPRTGYSLKTSEIDKNMTTR